ncbi:hypothetical protein ACFWCB_35400 [Streptomyces sp. NPDC060048]|uniref:hypothetical protein n=1 Tax=unclassified Streptomyces TaxID=2593676 RepID=UPI0036986C3B
MDDQGGAGGVPPSDGHGSRPKARRLLRRDEGTTEAADTDEASRLDQPSPKPGPRTGREHWTGPNPQDKGGEGEVRRNR